MGPSVKRCPSCEKTLPVEAFARCLSRYDGLQAECKDCRHARYIEHGSALVTSRTKENRKRIRREIDDYKLETGCEVCGYRRCSSALDFHHRDPGDKEFTVGEALARNMASVTVMAEIEKCILLCSNCHRELHEGLIDLEPR